MYVGNDRIWTGGYKISIQEFDISANRIKWKAEMGTSRMNRMKAAQKAIEALEGFEMDGRPLKVNQSRGKDKD